MNNKLLKIQEMLMREMNRIDNENMSIEEIDTEVARSNALTNSAMSFIKTVNVNIRVMELAKKQEVTVESLNNTLGLED